MASWSTLIGAGAAADVAPDSSPGAVREDRLLTLGERIPQTDEQPCSLWLQLFGTAGNTVVLSIWSCWDNPNEVASPDRKWCLVKSTITVTVGTVLRAPAIPGLCYVQVTTASAAASVLRAKVSSQPYATPTS